MKKRIKDCEIEYVFEKFPINCPVVELFGTTPTYGIVVGYQETENGCNVIVRRIYSQIEVECSPNKIDTMPLR